MGKNTIILTKPDDCILDSRYWCKILFYTIHPFFCCRCINV